MIVGPNAHGGVRGQLGSPVVAACPASGKLGVARTRAPRRAGGVGPVGAVVCRGLLDHSGLKSLAFTQTMRDALTTVDHTPPTGSGPRLPVLLSRGGRPPALRSRPTCYSRERRPHDGSFRNPGRCSSLPTSRIVIDLRDVDFPDSTGLHARLDAHAQAQQENWELTIIPGPRAVRRIFEITSTIDRLPFATANGRAATPNRLRALSRLALGWSSQSERRSLPKTGRANDTLRFSAVNNCVARILVTLRPSVVDLLDPSRNLREQFRQAGSFRPLTDADRRDRLRAPRGLWP